MHTKQKKKKQTKKSNNNKYVYLIIIFLSCIYERIKYDRKALYIDSLNYKRKFILEMNTQ